MVETAPPADMAFNFQDASVLIIDHSAGFTAIMSQMLAGFGFKTLHRCASLETCGTFSEGLKPDLVLIDIYPMREKAIDFIRGIRVKEASGGETVLVIVVTGQTQKENVTAARECGANYVVAKPFSSSVLLDRILWSAQPEAAWSGAELSEASHDVAAEALRDAARALLQ